MKTDKITALCITWNWYKLVNENKGNIQWKETPNVCFIYYSTGESDFYFHCLLQFFKTRKSAIVSKDTDGGNTRLEWVIRSTHSSPTIKNQFDYRFQNWIFHGLYRLSRNHHQVVSVNLRKSFRPVLLKLSNEAYLQDIFQGAPISSSS